MAKSFKKVLVANRGEIAVRIFKALRESSIRSVSVYSDVDKNSPHINYSDETFSVGEPEAAKSYLNIDKIIGIARSSRCDAIHPGYGFLAENHVFAKKCEDEGITFIGPSSEAIKLLGDKIESRKVMSKAGVPIIPGIDFKFQIDTLVREAKKMGLPVLAKAAAGGGGKGMRIIHKQADLRDSLLAAQREAKSAFGDDTVYVEKFLESPRHIEFQILADHHGNVVHCFERECSIQRRHQKIIEETPSTALDTDLRQRMGQVAIKVAKAASYTNAGTVEFLLDKNRNFYFLEVNTRIQVEHPVTEMTLGIDLVKEQIRIAQGEELSFKDEDLKRQGHSIECRIYAEDPENNFLPSPGKILYLKEPKGPGIRVDSGITQGQDIPLYYDPILAKLIVHAPSRNSAINRMIGALRDYTILGVKTPIPFLKAILENQHFSSGNIDTSFIENHVQDFKKEKYYPENLRNALVALAAFKTERKAHPKYSKFEKPKLDPWLALGKFELLSRE